MPSTTVHELTSWNTDLKALVGSVSASIKLEFTEMAPKFLLSSNICICACVSRKYVSEKGSLTSNCLPQSPH